MYSHCWREPFSVSRVVLNCTIRVLSMPRQFTGDLCTRVFDVHVTITRLEGGKVLPLLVGGKCSPNVWSNTLVCVWLCVYVTLLSTCSSIIPFALLFFCNMQLSLCEHLLHIATMPQLYIWWAEGGEVQGWVTGGWDWVTGGWGVWLGARGVRCRAGWPKGL